MMPNDLYEELLGENMKLRNKHTQEVKEFNEIFLTKTVKETDTVTSEYVERSYCSIDELNADWEDCKPVEPLIKNEKIRKAVRAWAEATGTTSISYWGGELESEQNDSKIEFDNITYVKFGDNYTIAELCGEEEK